MGILANTKQFLANKAISVAKKAGDGIASLSALSPKQLQEIDKKRVTYLSGKPDMTGEEAQTMISKNMGAIGIEVYQAYLAQLGAIYSPMDVSMDTFDDENRIRFFEITRWVRDAEEKSLDKLLNVYHVLTGEDCNIALIYDRKVNSCHIYLAVANTSEKWSDPAIVDKYYARIVGAIEGNFPGTEIAGVGSKDKDYGIGVPICVENVCNTEDGVKSVAIVSNVASDKSEGFTSQSMEKLLDGIVPENPSEEYTIILLAKPVQDQLESKNRLYELYTALSPYAGWQTGYTYTELEGKSSSASFGVNLGVSAGVHSTVNTALAQQKGHTDTAGGHAGFEPIAGVNYNHAYQRGTTETRGAGSGYNASANFGVSFSRSSSVTAQVGKNESLSQTYTNFGVKHTLEIIETQLKRIEASTALGMWEFASYIVSDSPVVANNVAHMYLALTQGEDSYISEAAINFWDGDVQTDEAKDILASVGKLQHPVFGLKSSLEDEWLMYPTLVTPTTPLSGLELARALNFPKKSVSGLPVLEGVEFGREPHSLIKADEDLELGNGYHMRHEVKRQRIKLSKEELTKHTFITGSTGSGKSNTIYKLLGSLNNNDVRFLVIESAKGEYKTVFGGRENVCVYGTNPDLNDCSMLRINPFRFPKGVHILEHLDRLIEIFNVCWPMYAAMSAILKDAVERAYVVAGWDLISSTNKYDELYPTFYDVFDQIKKVLYESDYSDDNKGDYTGALVTRIRSLTNGINGLIFTNDDIDDEDLFNRNVIVDLSRVGSTETKALIMGLLVLKLQEYRMDSENPNSSLKHVTVLEEAHNLLKRTSTEQTTEGANLIGKSVEMLANSIAEMRTYGEGFIIADQSPGLLDMSVIRNTNTKIILRLPDFSDRELVGKASGLNDAQIMEIGRLEKGVASITQGDWIEPVLCKIDLFDKRCEWKSEGIIMARSPRQGDDKKSLLNFIMSREIYRKSDKVDMLKLRKSIIASSLETTVKCEFLEYLESEQESAVHKLRKLVFDFLEAGKAFEASRRYDDIKEWVKAVVDNLNPSVKDYSNRQINILLALIVNEQALRNPDYVDVFNKFTEVYNR